jgi:hypothetical protein
MVPPYYADKKPLKINILTVYTRTCSGQRKEWIKIITDGPTQKRRRHILW